MENQLDEIAGGDAQAVDFLTSFYFGSDRSADGSIAHSGGLKKLVTDNLSDIDARSVNSIPLFKDDEGRDVVVRVGRYGPYLQRTLPGAEQAPPSSVNGDGESENGNGGGGDRASIPEGVAPDELTPEKVDELFLGGGGERSSASTPRPASRSCSSPAASARTCRPATATRRCSSRSRRTRCRSTDALRLLTLPRVVGVDAADGAEVLAASGRYGPYVKKGDEFRSLDSEEKLFTVTLDEALALLAAPKTRQRRAAAPPLREMGVDPLTEKPLVIKDGRFGPYVTDGETNASLRRGQTPESLSIEQASEMLAEKRANPSTPRKKATKAAAKKATPAKKTTAAKKTREEDDREEGHGGKKTAAEEGDRGQEVRRR